MLEHADNLAGQLTSEKHKMEGLRKLRSGFYDAASTDRNYRRPDPMFSSRRPDPMFSSAMFGQ